MLESLTNPPNQKLFKNENVENYTWEHFLCIFLQMSTFLKEMPISHKPSIHNFHASTLGFKPYNIQLNVSTFCANIHSCKYKNVANNPEGFAVTSVYSKMSSEAINSMDKAKTYQ